MCSGVLLLSVGYACNSYRTHIGVNIGCQSMTVLLVLRRVYSLFSTQNSAFPDGSAMSSAARSVLNILSGVVSVSITDRNASSEHKETGGETVSAAEGPASGTEGNSETDGAVVSVVVQKNRSCQPVAYLRVLISPAVVSTKVRKHQRNLRATP